MKMLSALLMVAPATACSSPKWPEEKFPADMTTVRTLFANSEPGLRETCEAQVVEISDEAATRLIRVERTSQGYVLTPPKGDWKNTPLTSDFDTRSSYQGAFGGCGAKSGPPLGDLPGALERPGAFYKVINGGEGIAIIAPRAKLAGFFYAG